MKNYQLNCGQYVLHEDNRPIGHVLDELAIAYSIDQEAKCPVLYKIGDPATVKQWVDKSKGKMAAIFDVEIKMIQGRFPVDAVNLIMAGRMGMLNELIARVNSIDVEAILVVDESISNAKLCKPR